MSRDVRAFNALGSLLYWKAAGRRTDGNLDSTFDDRSPNDDRDIDFGPAHSTTITAEELGLLSRWIDIGSPGGAGELRDTTRPTLTMAGVVRDGAVAALRVGTLDVPSGIDPASLEVCVLDGASDGGCGPNLATAAAMHDAIELALSTPLRDPEQQVRARVRDRAGNETVVQYTVRWLLGMSPAPVPVDDVQPVDASASASADGSSASDGGAPAGAGSSCACSTPSRTGASGGPAWALLTVAGVMLQARRR